MGEFFVGTIIIGMFVIAGISFRGFSRSKEFENLLDSYPRISLNMVSLLVAFLRSRNDPLRRAHVKLAVIGFLHVVVLLSCVFGFITLADAW